MELAGKGLREEASAAAVKDGVYPVFLDRPECISSAQCCCIGQVGALGSASRCSSPRAAYGLAGLGAGIRRRWRIYVIVLEKKINISGGTNE